MKKITIALFLCLFLFNCSKKENTIGNTPYVISKNDLITNISNKPKNSNLPPPPPIPGWLLYGTNAFIIDKDSKIYYYQSNTIEKKGSCVKNDIISYFTNLQPKDLIQIPNHAISDFVHLNYTNGFQNITIIASKADTLKTQNYFDLMNAIEASSDENDFYFIRRTTQEEDTVLKYKKENKNYNSKFIKWDNKRITFPKSQNLSN